MQLELKSKFSRKGRKKKIRLKKLHLLTGESLTEIFNHQRF